jgi:uncharacterized protein involved in exopolysaccharide biosynthesis
MSARRDGDDDILGLSDARLAAGFVLRSVGRHGRLAGSVFALAGLATTASFLAAPRVYHTEVKLLAQRNLIMPALGNPRRTVPMDSDAPTRLAAETVLRRENLVSVLRTTRLIEEWERTRAPVLRLKDRILRPLLGPPTEDDKLESLIGLLRKKVYVGADEGTVTIGIDWPDAGTACRIVEVMQQNFLEERHASEVSSIADAISILEGHASGTRGTIEAALDEVRRSSPPPAPRAPSVGTRHEPVPEPADAALVSLQVLLEAKRRAITDLEEFRQSRLAELYTLLAEQKNTYGPAHPAIAGTQQSILALSGESPQIAALRREEAEMAGEIRRRRAPARAPAPDVTTADLGREPSPDPGVSYARSRLKSAIAEYEDLLERLEGARIELDTARAAFKYRYGVITPAQTPRKPVSPAPVSFFGIGLVLALALAVAAALAADLAGGRVVESWQVERFLGLEVLAEVARP